VTVDAAVSWPSELQINAYSGDTDAGAIGAVAETAMRWTFRPQGDALPKLLRPSPPTEPYLWRKPDVGWGLILPDTPDLTDEQRCTGSDAPEAIRELLAARPGSPVLRYVPQIRFTHLRRHYANRPPQDIALSGSTRGIRPGQLPRFLLIYGTPDEIPWEFQYLLNQSAAVGRLTLQGEALEHYVAALLRDWDDSEANIRAAVVWAVDHGGDDMSGIMRRVIAEPVQAALASDRDLGPGTAYLGNGAGPATRSALTEALRQRHPSLVVTTSHGMTGPLDDHDTMRANLGLPVDADHNLLTPNELLAVWQPDGAVWYAHACCSAGSDASTIFDGLVTAGSMVDRVLQGVAAIGAHVAPLPLALLGAPRPLRAFVGHVEPTFDWTIRHPSTGQPLTDSIKAALYDQLYQPRPIGHALRECYEHVGQLFGQRTQAYQAFNRGADTRDVALASQLAALDRQSMVILGDPTAMLPPLDA
jgi:hypothetical protein